LGWVLVRIKWCDIRECDFLRGFGLHLSLLGRRFGFCSCIADLGEFWIRSRFIGVKGWLRIS
jgi:hypothetical protein